MENGQAAKLGFVSLQITLSYKLPIMLPYPYWPAPSPSNSLLSDYEILKCRPRIRPLLANGTNFTATVIQRNKRCYY